MSNQDISLILSILSLVIVLAIGIKEISLMKRHQQYNIIISSIVEKYHTELNIRITNNGLRPITITSFTIGYGTQSDQQIFLTENLIKPRKVNDGGIFSYSISRNNIIKAVKEKSVIQGHSQRLWVGVVLSTGKTLYKSTEIDPSIIKKDYLPNAEAYISTDLFIGFPQMEPTNEPNFIALSVNDGRQFK